MSRTRTERSSRSLSDQYVNRRSHCAARTIASGTIGAARDRRYQVRQTSRVKRIIAPGGDLEQAQEGAGGDAVLEDETRPRAATSWVPDAGRMWRIGWRRVSSGSRTEMVPGRRYIPAHGDRPVSATVTELKHRINIDDFAQEATRRWRSTRSVSATCRCRRRCLR